MENEYNENESFGEIPSIRENSSTDINGSKVDKSSEMHVKDQNVNKTVSDNKNLPEANVLDEKNDENLKDSNKQRLKTEYLEVLMLIDAQNQLVNSLKEKFNEKCRSYEHTKSEEIEIRNLRCCLEKECSKLRHLLQKATELQENDVNHSCKIIEVATTIEEDSLPINLNLKNTDDNAHSSFSYLKNQINVDKSTKINFRNKSSFGNNFRLPEDSDRLRNKCKDAEGSGTRTSRGNEIGRYICQKLIDSIHVSQDKLANDNSYLECDRIRLQKELHLRDTKIDSLKEKFNNLQKELCNFLDSNETQNQTSECTIMRNKSVEALQNITNYNKNFTLKIDDMQSIVNCLKNDIEDLKKQRLQKQSENESHTKNEIFCISNTKCGEDELVQIEAAYKILQADCSKKEAELFYLKEKIKKSTSENYKENNTHRTEKEILQKKFADIREEQENFKNIFVEQAEQLEEYQYKLQLANQKLKEQKCFLGKIEVQNKRIESQIDFEIQNIKEKFHQKLQDLAKIPKFIENERKKLKVVYQDHMQLERKLCIICRDYQELKNKYKQPFKDENGKLNFEERYKKATEELESLKIQYQNLKTEYDDLNEKIQIVLNETDVMRTEVAREIATINERSELVKDSLESYIQKIKKELIECQQNTDGLIKRREEVISRMRKQLNTLSRSFDMAQKQIGILKAHMQKMPLEDLISQ